MMKEGRKKLVFEACYSVARNEDIPVKYRMVVLQACEALYEKEGEKMPNALHDVFNELYFRYKRS